MRSPRTSCAFLALAAALAVGPGLLRGVEEGLGADERLGGEGDEPRGAGEEAGQAGPEAPAGDDAQALQVLGVHLADLERAAVTATDSGLKLSVVLVPDAAAYRAAREYLKRRQAGDPHPAALRAAAVALAGIKKIEGMAAVEVKIENPSPPPAPAGFPSPPRKVFTIQKELLGETLAILGDGGRPVPARLAELPQNLRRAQIRVKKFWTTADGRGRRGAYDPEDASSIGRKPLLSKPTAALLIEDKPVRMEILFNARHLKPALPRCVLREVKRYEGPFQEDQLDLNGGRRWDPIPPLEVALQPPPGGLKTPPALLRLLAEVQGAAAGLPRPTGAR